MLHFRCVCSLSTLVVLPLTQASRPFSPSTGKAGRGDPAGRATFLCFASELLLLPAPNFVAAWLCLAVADGFHERASHAGGN